ncbi:hypothetical protein SKAU_G00150660 [Synaphobranchus kaupii]|uniref:TRAF family member-associated NF-kappa-B activator n=1 Tax=Synaphobranchus kaupii TaxID=118154 RepID=A0A9Q1FGM4_SYNKA|nr:hypothetical protein SKAU_G00150660 [Synaphobranchus kaupii]
MEQAYEDLYREFLRLRSVCLKQAALLHHLTEALAQQKAAASAPNAGPRAPTAVPILKKHGRTSEGCAQAMARLLPSAGQNKSCTAAAGDGRAADVIARGTDRLQCEGRGTEAHRAATMGPLVPPGLNREPAPPGGSGDALRPEQQLREVFYKAINDFDAPDGTTRRRKPLWMFSSFLDSEMISQGGGLMMSEVALHSQVCEFCQAVFPGNTTTRGEFLRHLTAHI